MPSQVGGGGDDMILIVKRRREERLFWFAATAATGTDSGVIVAVAIASLPPCHRTLLCSFPSRLSRDTGVLCTGYIDDR